MSIPVLRYYSSREGSYDNSTTVQDEKGGTTSSSSLFTAIVSSTRLLVAAHDCTIIVHERSFATSIVGFDPRYLATVKQRSSQQVKQDTTTAKSLQQGEKSGTTHSLENECARSTSSLIGTLVNF